MEPIEISRPSGWQDDPFEGDWWLTALLWVWFTVERMRGAI
jgi:hypothetical protein